MRKTRPSLPALAALAAGRDHITTAEFAGVTQRAVLTIREQYRRNGQVYGVTPLKFGNKLLWPVHEISRLLSGRSAA